MFEANKSMNRLFEIYLEEEIGSAKELIERFENKGGREIEFYDFVMSHIDDFKIDSKLLQETYSSPEEIISQNSIMASKRVVANLTRANIRGKQKFVDMAKAITGGGRVLEVGSGTDLPVTSILLAKDLGEVTTMDYFHNHWSSLDFFHKIKVNAKHEYFREGTSVEGIDTVVGQHPCEAIIPVVGKPVTYFIEACDCAAPQSSMNEFLDYLRTKDSKLKSVTITRNPVGRRFDYLLNSNNPLSRYSDQVFITNADMHPDDILAKIVEIDSRDR